MEKAKNAGRFRKLLARYNNPIVWVFCGVMAVAQVDLIYKMLTGQVQKLSESEIDEEIKKEKEELAQMVNTVKETFNKFKHFIGANESEESDSIPD